MLIGDQARREMGRLLLCALLSSVMSHRDVAALRQKLSLKGGWRFLIDWARQEFGLDRDKAFALVNCCFSSVC